MTSLSELKFFMTPEHECSYLPDEQAITLFADPLTTIDTALYSSLSAVGFRRSGSHIYRPYCENCSACIPVRIPAAEFTHKRRHQRVWKKNRNVTVSNKPPLLTDEYFELYDRYIKQRHADGDMYPAEPKQFQSFLVDGREEAVFYEFREDGKLLAVAVADILLDGISAIYTFFDPDDRERSLGVFAVLWLIQETRRLSLDHLYLGYWIKDCQKMNYKTDYKPIEFYVNNHWVSLEN